MLRRLALVTVGLVFVVIQVTAKQPRSVPKYTDWRLPRWLLPRHYKLRLLPFIEEGNFTTQGRVDILLECMEPTQLIVLHMAEITIPNDGLQVFQRAWFFTCSFLMIYSCNLTGSRLD